MRSLLFICTPDATDLDDIAARTLRAAPQRIAALGQEIVHQLDYTQPRATSLSDDDMHLAHTIAEAPKVLRLRPLIISGSSSASVGVLQAAANVCTALTKAGRTPSIALLLAEANSLGTALLGGADLDAALARIEAGEIDTLVVVENNLLPPRRCAAPRRRAEEDQEPCCHRFDFDATGCCCDPGQARRQLRRNRWHAGQLRRPCAALLPAMSPTTTQTEESWRWLQKTASRVHNMADVPR